MGWGSSRHIQDNFYPKILVMRIPILMAHSTLDIPKANLISYILPEVCHILVFTTRRNIKRKATFEAINLTEENDRRYT